MEGPGEGGRRAGLGGRWRCLRREELKREYLRSSTEGTLDPELGDWGFHPKGPSVRARVLQQNFCGRLCSLSWSLTPGQGYSGGGGLYVAANWAL